MQVCANLYDSEQADTSPRKSVHVYASMCEFTRVCASSRWSARVHTGLRELTRVCASLRVSARVYAGLHFGFFDKKQGKVIGTPNYKFSISFQ